jgi:large subunit ribosomal protein L22
MVTAYLKNYRQSPRKVRLIADLVKNKEVVRALGILRFLDKRAADPVIKLLNSAVANAKHNHDLALEDLYIQEIRVDEGTMFPLFLPPKTA